MAEVVMKPHHMQNEVATNRPEYRDSRWETAVKVYTINQESKYLIVINVPALGVVKELLALFTVYGEIEEYKVLDEYPCEPFTDVYFLKYKQIDSARAAKRKLDKWYFFSRQLHVCYAPEYELQIETREKLMQRQEIIAFKGRENRIFHQPCLIPVPPLPLKPPNQITSPEQAIIPFLPNIPNLTPPPILAPPLRPPPPGLFPHRIPPHHIPPHHILPPRILPPNNPYLFNPLSVPGKYALTHPRFHPTHGIHQLRPELPRGPPPSRLSLSYHPPVLVRPPSPVEVRRPPPLISDHSQRFPFRPPPLLSDPPATKPVSPPPLVNTSSSTRIGHSNKAVATTVASKTNSLSTAERVKLHLEEEGTNANQPIRGQYVKNTAATTTMKNIVEEGSKRVEPLPQQPSARQVPVLQVHGQPQDANVNRIAYKIRHGNDHGGSKVVQGTLVANNNVQSCSQSVDSTVSNIRQKMSKIFMPPPEIESFQTQLKKRRRI